MCCCVFVLCSFLGKSGALLETLREMCMKDANKFGDSMAAKYKLDVMQQAEMITAFKKLSI